MRKPVTYIRVTIAERFPVFYSHVNQKCRRANDPETQGPFYAAGSEFLHLHTEQKMAWARSSAEHLRRDGYTVTVDLVER